MSVYISPAIRKLVIARAGHRCEYCRILEYLSCYPYHVDHIIGIQHGGPNTPNNLAHTCSPCNWKKGQIEHLIKESTDDKEKELLQEQLQKFLPPKINEKLKIN